MFLISVIHTAAHIVNAVNFSLHYNAQFSEINWAKYKGQVSTIVFIKIILGLLAIF